MIGADGLFKIPAGTDILVQATSIGLYPDTGCPDIDYDTILLMDRKRCPRGGHENGSAKGIY